VINATNNRTNFNAVMEGPDDITYGKVTFNQVNTITVRNMCSRPLRDGGPYWSVSFQRWIVPPAVHGNTVYLGPAGQRWA
jgi:hypothetical protein